MTVINDWWPVRYGHRDDGERELAAAIAERHRAHRQFSSRDHPEGSMSRLDLRPLHAEPVSVRAPYDVRRPLIRDVAARRLDYLAALHEPLNGIPLGTYDEQIIRWLAGWDVPTVGTLASLVHRARAARPLAGVR